MTLNVSLNDNANVWEGWGTTLFGGDYSDILQEVQIPIVTDAVCMQSMGPLHGGQVCAGGEKDRDACQGSVLHSHWSRNVGALLSLVERFIVLLRQLSYAIKNQLGLYGIRERWLPCT